MLRSVQLKVHAFALFNVANRLKPIGEEKWLFDLLTFSRVVRAEAIFYLFIYLFIFGCWVFVSVRGPSLVAASWGHSSSWCAGLPPSRPLSLLSTSSRCAGSVIVAHGPSCSTACRIFPDQGSNPCPLHWQADSQPLHHQGSPQRPYFQNKK